MQYVLNIALSVHGVDNTLQAFVGMQQRRIVTYGCNDYVAFGDLWDVGCFYYKLFKHGDIGAVLGADVHYGEF